MSSEIDITALISPPPDPLDADPLEYPRLADRVLQTASDRPETDTLPPLADPAADHERRRASQRAGTTSRRSISGSATSSTRPATTPWCSGGPTRSPGSPPAATWASDLGERGRLGPALHQPDQPRGDHRQRPERPRLRGRAGRPGLPAQGAALVRRPRPGRRRAVPQQAGRPRPGLRLDPLAARRRCRSAPCAAG